MKIKDKSRIQKILFITLSNIGDIILTTPVLSVLRREFPDAAIDVLAGPNGAELFTGHPLAANFIVYDKSSEALSKKNLVKRLRKNKYNLVVDLRNSLFPLLIGARYRTSLVRRMPAGLMHKRDEHLWRLKQLGLDIENAPFAFYIDKKDVSFIDELLKDLDIRGDFAVVSPGAKSHIKRWTKEGFAFVCDRLIEELGLAVVMVGDTRDKEITAGILGLMKNKAFDLSSKLNLRQLGELIRRSKLLITNDSAPMHIGCAVGARILAIFGPTDPKKYGPKGNRNAIIRNPLPCSPCEVAQCKKNHECMKLISPEEVFEAACKITKQNCQTVKLSNCSTI